MSSGRYWHFDVTPENQRTQYAAAKMVGAMIRRYPKAARKRRVVRKWANRFGLRGWRGLKP